MRDLTLESSMDNYRKSCFVLRSGVLRTPVDFTCCSDKESLRVSHASDVVMSVDGHHVGVDLESSQAASSNPTSSQVTSSGSAACDVALCFAEGDKRAAVILKQLLLEKVPSLKISEPMAGDFTRVQSLDVARMIVPLLSPAFLASSELVEELNIAIYRNRSSSRRILFPIQVAAIPLKPSYVHLIPCEFSSSDYKWACKIADVNLQDDVSRMAERNYMDVDEAYCLKTAAGVISERLSEESKPDLSLVNRVLLNVHEVEAAWNQVQTALQREEGLETSWKATFGIEIKSKEDDLKPARIIEQDEVKPNADNKPVIGDKTESDGVELHLKDVKNDGQIEAVETDDQPHKLKEHSESDHCLESESNKVEKSVRFQDDLTDHRSHEEEIGNIPVATLDGDANVSNKDSKSCALI